MIDLHQKIEFFPHISLLDRTILTKHLATLIHAGIPLVESLQTVADQAESATLKRKLESAIKDVQNGLTLSEALGKQKNLFDDFYISMIKVGETAGTLEENLLFLNKHLTAEYNLRQKVRGAMMYPAVVLAATVIIGGFISIFILPQLVTFFDAFEVELPLPTKILVGTATFMQSYGLLFFATLALLSFAATRLLQTKYIKPVWHRAILQIPVFGKLLHYTQITRFNRNLGTLLKSGVPIAQALEITTDTLSNIALQKLTHKLGVYLNEGKTFGSTLQKPDFKLFPNLMRKMLTVGEKTGKLEDTLLYVAEFYDEEINSITKNLSVILEPILLLVIGAVVGFVALAIIGPIYQLTGSISQ